MKTSRSILILMFSFVFLMVIGIVLAVHYRVPAELDCASCKPDTVSSDFFAKGTGITPPVVVVIPYLLFGLLIQKRALVGLLGNLGIFVISCVYTIASILEPALTHVYQDAFDLKASGVLPAITYTIGAGIVVVIFVLNLQNAISRLQTRQTAPRTANA
ncbi:MAG: hypothetical protein HY862_14530 [Chloroflexi bacterium]|nr:hypothetical protein [Chloroflexota bacterium]